MIWLSMTGAALDGLAVGAVTVAAATWLSLQLLPPHATRRISFLEALRIVPVFLWRSVLGGIDVGRRALSPRMPLNPGWKEVPARLPPGAPRAVVGGEFSLLPGALVAGTRGDLFLIHALDVDQDIERDIEEAEKALAVALGLEEASR